MCIAIVKKKNGVITDEALRNSFQNNPDGAGIAYVKDNVIYMIKGIFDEDEFVDKVRQAEQIAQGSMLIHCRIGTSGLKDHTNCHPHKVNNANVLIHNGILSIDVPKDSKVSDTVLFIEKFMKDLPYEMVYNKSILNMLEELIGKSNKFCILNTNGDVAIVNEQAGHWENDVWYSNSTYSYSSYSFGKYSGSFYGWDDIPISKKVKKRINKTIDFLSWEQAQLLGEYPTCDPATGMLYNGENTNFPFLEEINYELYDRYFDMYSTIMNWYNDIDSEVANG